MPPIFLDYRGPQSSYAFIRKKDAEKTHASPIRHKSPGGTGFQPVLYSPFHRARDNLPARRPSPAFNGIISDVLPLLQKFRLIPDNSVITLILPEGALISPCLVDFSGAEAFDAVENFRQVKSSTFIPAIEVGPRHAHGQAKPPRHTTSPFALLPKSACLQGDRAVPLATRTPLSLQRQVMK